MDIVNYSAQSLDDFLLRQRPRFCVGCQWCEPSIKGDDIERRMDQAKGLAGMRCDRGRLVHRDEPGFLVVP